MDGRGRTASTGDDDHLRDLIEQVLFTAPGERVMRPDFGSGLLGLVFEPNGPGLAAATRHLVEAALQRELGDLHRRPGPRGRAGRGQAQRLALVRRAPDADPVHDHHRGVRGVRYFCCDERRLRAVKDAGVLNGIEYLEVSDSEAPPGAAPAHALRAAAAEAPGTLTKANVVIEGGERIPVKVEWALPASPLPAGEDAQLTAGLDDPGDVLLVRTDSTGDYSTYTLRLVAGAGSEEPPAGFDPLLASVDFSFKVECPTDFDCAPACDCPPEEAEALEIDYLAKDYQSFRSLMLDRLSLLAPGWQERSSADLGVALVELLAYVGGRALVPAGLGRDRGVPRHRAAAHLAAPPRAARRLRRPRGRERARVAARLRERRGRAAAGLHARADARAEAARRHRPGRARAPGRARCARRDVRDARRASCSTSRTSASTSGRGATTAAACRAARPRRRCVGDHPQLKAGDVLVLAEVAGPRTGRPEDADPAKRLAVRLTHVVPSSDPSGGLFDDPPTNDPVDVTEIAWDEEDALPFPLCISVEDRPGLVVSEAWGNVVLADHGRTVAGEELGTVPDPVLFAAGEDGCDPCEHEPAPPVPIRFRPLLGTLP